MDAHKVNEAAEDNIPAHAPDALYDEGFVGGFMACANWLMQQPLADRLTEDEKEKIKEIFKRANDSYVANDNLNTPRTPTEAHSRGYVVGVMSAIEDIFGRELFNEK